MGRTGGRGETRLVDPTEELHWEQIELMYGWPEQRDYELTRPLKLFKALGLGKRVLYVINSAETGYEKPYLRAYRRILHTVDVEVEALRHLVGVGSFASHGWRGNLRGLSHPTRVRCL